LCKNQGVITDGKDIHFFNPPFFVIVGGLTTLIVIVGFVVTAFLVIKGVLSVWYRLGIGLSKRKIAIFAKDEFDNLKNLLIDSGLFKEKNIVKIDKSSLRKAENISLLLVHYKPFENEIDNILDIKRDQYALIIYAPKEEGDIKKEILQKINLHRNTIIVNFRGRLLNDIFISMITTSYKLK